MSDHIVRAVAPGLVVGRLAAAEIERAGRRRDELQRLDVRLLVRAVAERLAFRQAAPAVPIGLPFDEFDLIRAGLRDDGGKA